MRIRLCSDIGHVMPKIDLEAYAHQADENKNVYVLRHVDCWGLKRWVKSATVGPVTDTYLELKMLCLFYFVLESEKKA